MSGLDGLSAALPATPGVVVCVPVFNAYNDVVQCLSALVACTHASVPIIVLDDGSVDPRLRKFSAEAPHNLVIWHRPDNIGFVATVNIAFQAAGKADVVIVNSDVVVGPEWLDRLRAVAYSLPHVATVTPLTNHGTMVSVGHGRNEPLSRLPEPLLPALAAERVARASRHIRPLIPTAIGHCTYFRRSALDAVGLLDEAFAPGYSEEVDFSQRALERGFVHACADDVFVFHRGGSSFGRSDKVKKLIAEHDKLISQRYPYYFDWISQVSQERGSPLEAALLVADTAVRGLRLIVDGQCLGPTTMGTQAVVLESIRALARHSSVAEMTVAVPKTVPARTLATLQGCGVNVVVSAAAKYSWKGPTDVDLVYRPYQVTLPEELEWLLSVAPRVVVAQLDSIAYNNPSYFENWKSWHRYRTINRLTCRFADGMTFLSETSLRDASASGLLPRGASTSVVFAGTDNVPSSSARRPPEGLDNNVEEFFLCLGASYRHKNRILALLIWEVAREQGWTGDIVLAGPTPPDGNSLPEEDEFVLAHPALAPSIWRFGALSDGEKEWLYDRAAVVLYPTLAEGFGLVPFEAAAHNVPCLSTRAGALDEILPTDIPTIDVGDITGTARLAIDMAQDSALRKQVCESLNSRAAEFTWDITAERLVEFFRDVLGRPSRGQDRVPDMIRATALPGSVAATRTFRLVHGPLAWAIKEVVDRPQLRRALVPPGSLRLRFGSSIVRSLTRRSA